MTEEEMLNIVANSRIKVSKERNPNYDEILSSFEDFSKKVENETTFETIVEKIYIFCEDIFAIGGIVCMVIFAIFCIQKFLS